MVLYVIGYLEILVRAPPYDQGRTLTHEVGHWLNLRHIWGDQNCGDDFCNDTPEHSGSNYGSNYPSTSSCQVMEVLEICL